MPRKKNDGRGRLGGRQAGTPNKDNPIKTLLHEHSMEYFMPNIDAKDVEWASEEWKAIHEGETFSRYELDLMCMKSADRVKAELEVLQYHTPKMQSVTADMTVNDAAQSFSSRLRRLADGEDIPADSE